MYFITYDERLGLFRRSDSYFDKIPPLMFFTKYYIEVFTLQQVFKKSPLQKRGTKAMFCNYPNREENEIHPLKNKTRLIVTIRK